MIIIQESIAKHSFTARKVKYSTAFDLKEPSFDPDANSHRHDDMLKLYYYL